MARTLETVPEPDFGALPPSVMLNDQEPFQLARTADGARRVEEVLTRIDYGMFS